MNRSYFFFAVGLMGHAAMLAQAQPVVSSFQQADSLAAGRGGRGGGVPAPRAETGKPFSATAITQSTQTFLDGTHVSRTTTAVEYRDAEGRVRTETSQPAGSSSEQMKVVTIRDPVAGVSYRLDPAKRSAVRLSIEAESGRDGSPIAVLQAGQAARKEPNDIVEDLGTATVNGVPARGTRITSVVPAGAIGNDREFRSVTERWFSPDLNLLIKSINTDPRFGTTTYELTNISRVPPAPALFQVPAGYSFVSNVIEGIEFRGMSHLSQDTLRATITIKLGDVYDEDAIRRDFTALWNTNRLNDVHVETEPGPRGGAIVRFVVTERP